MNLLFSLVIAPIYIPTNAKRIPFSHVLITCFYKSFYEVCFYANTVLKSNYIRACLQLCASLDCLDLLVFCGSVHILGLVFCL